jgi:hypothetical protein
MMTHIDITFDLETAGRTANCAVMQVAAVAWQRDAEGDPFYEGDMEHYIYNEHIDLRTCLVDGFEFEPETVAWWSQRSEAAKRAVCAGLPEPVEEVFTSFLHWIEYVVKATGANSVCLWCQGSDFDIAILRNICHRYDLHLDDIIAHTQFRDARCIILEALLIRARQLYREAIAKAKFMANDVPYPLPPVLEADVLRGDSKAYQLFDPLPDRYARGSEAHDALYDAMRTSWNTWQALRWLSL